MFDCPDGGCPQVRTMARQIEDVLSELNDCTRAMIKEREELVVTIERLQHINMRLLDGVARFEKIEGKVDTANEEIIRLKASSVTSGSAGGISGSISVLIVAAWEIIKSIAK